MSEYLSAPEHLLDPITSGSPLDDEPTSSQDPVETILNLYPLNPEEFSQARLDHLIDYHPAVQEAVTELDSLRASQEHRDTTKENEMVASIKSLRREIGEQFKERLGIVEESPEAKDRRLEIDRLNQLGVILANLTGNESDDVLLAKFGLVTSSGNMTPESMQSPLFKIETQKAFTTYLHYAQLYDRLEQAEELAGRALKNTAEASIVRTEMHDRVARLVADDLGLSFNPARRLVAKAREAVVPGLHEKTSYADLIRGQRLIDKFGSDALVFSQEALKKIIESPMSHERK